ncbi:unnamed protein product [Trifolium pratense]|uniref:Uncharacterized protein n=1 Tax=Trifolium pratense TaxID=57577 RepID=A0ACB0IBF6_TRIPR|nr:unnamed protein product [Trifolium pratense]
MNFFQYSTTIFFISITFLLFLPSSKPISNYNTLVYKTCSTQTFNHESYSQSLDSLFQQLITQSSQHKFFKTNEAIDDHTFISGFFQCRNDINNEDCFTCVTSLLPHISNTLCNDSTSARLQLQGCYVQYRTEQFQEKTIRESKNNDMFHKICRVPIVEYYVEFKELMEEAFMMLENGIINSDGFYAMDYKKVKLMAQCESGLRTCDCSECVNDAVMVAKEECDGSASAKIYFDKCFISYTYMLKSGNGDDDSYVPGASRNNNSQKSQKLIAIIVGGAATLFLGLIFVSLLNSRLRKDDYE